ncbi:MAG TPA: MBL fold metallo-hydrolase [Candidatus Limnocylindrales bacterium]|nr:MBL fold metallo-hydrolase [Candidatus Limnocylindrales bacterium]
MNITKYEHACLVIEEQGQKLIVDPGVFSESCTDFTNVVAVIVTHIHPDHYDPEKLAEIIKQNSGAMIFTVQEVANDLAAHGLPATEVIGGSNKACGPYKLDFYGGQHALIHKSLPINQNIAVMVNDTLYYPGDSFTIPHKPVALLALPSSGPWMKISEAVDFVAAVKPKRIFPTHNAILSDIGAGIHNRVLQGAAQNIAAEYIVLSPGETLTLD